MLLISLLVATASVSCGAPSTSESTVQDATEGRAPDIKRKSKAKVKEASGLAVFTDGRGQSTLFAIGDVDPVITTGMYPDDDHDIDFSVAHPRVDLATLYPAGYASVPSQWEAVAVDGAKNLIALQEKPGALHIFNSRLDKLLAIVPLVVPSGDPLYADYNRDPNSLGEGFVLLKDGHILLVKEKDPILLIEFAPKGERPLGFVPSSLLGRTDAWKVTANGAPLFPVKVWPAGDSIKNNTGDLSDLAVDGAGHLFALGDQGRKVFLLSGKSRSEERDMTLLPNGDGFRALYKWKLPSEIVKPEGLAFVEGNRAIVASDDCNGNCVFTMSRLTP